MRTLAFERDRYRAALAEIADGGCVCPVPCTPDDPCDPMRAQQALDMEVGRDERDALVAAVRASMEWDRVLRKPNPTKAESYEAVTGWRAALAPFEADR